MYSSIMPIAILLMVWVITLICGLSVPERDLLVIIPLGVFSLFMAMSESRPWPLLLPISAAAMLWAAFGLDSEAPALARAMSDWLSYGIRGLAGLIFAGGALALACGLLHSRRRSQVRSDEFWTAVLRARDLDRPFDSRAMLDLSGLSITQRKGQPPRYDTDRWNYRLRPPSRVACRREPQLRSFVEELMPEVRRARSEDKSCPGHIQPVLPGLDRLERFAAAGDIRGWLSALADSTTQAARSAAPRHEAAFAEIQEGATA